MQKFLEKYYKKDEKIILACSAGPDSMFLLYKLLETNYKENIVVCYFNHKTRPETQEEEMFLEELCKKENIAFETASCDFEKIAKLYPSKSFEELAREKRYQFFGAICEIYGVAKVITAHHLDDKIETFYFNLNRGSKLTGLVNMKESHGGILRPLLDLEKGEILDFLRENNLKYFVDESNKDSKYTRNYLRNEVIPKFEKVNSAYKKNIGNTLKYFTELKDFLDKYVDNFLNEQGIQIFNSEKYKINTLEIYGYFYIKDFLELDLFIQKEIIKNIFYKSNNNSTIGLSESNIGDILKFINGKNNKTIKEIKDLKMRKENEIIIF